MKKKIIIISLIAALLFVVFILYNVISTIDIPQNIENATIFDTITGKEKTIYGNDAIKIVDLMKKAKKDYSRSCPTSNIRISFNSSENNGERMWVYLSADDCPTLWCDNVSYRISDKCNQQLKEIIIDYGFSISMP